MIKPISEKIAIVKGKEIKLTLFSLINDKFDLFKKNGQVAPKCVSAKINIVKKIKYVSNFGTV